MIDLRRPGSCAHPLRHKVLRERVDHPVFFGDEVPRRLYLPGGSRSPLLNACDSDWPLCCGKKGGPLGGRVLRESSAKSFMWHPDEPVRIGRQMRRLRMRLFAIEQFGDRLAFVGRQGCDKGQRPDSRVGGRCYDRAGIGVRYQDHRATGAFERAVKRGDIIRQGRQRQRGCQDL